MIQVPIIVFGGFLGLIGLGAQEFEGFARVLG